jgi:hypothetical protein
MKGLPILGFLLLSGCSCGADCGAGTHARDGECVPNGGDSDSDVDLDVDVDVDADTDTATDTETDTASDTVSDTGTGDAACDPFASPTGCAKGEKCAIVLSLVGDPPRLDCVPDGDKLVGEACNYLRDAPDRYDDCAEGGFCYDDLGTRVCEKMCWETGGCDDVGVAAYCAFFTDLTEVGRCRPDEGCNSCLQTGCPAGEGCYVVGDGTNYIHTCTTQSFENEDGSAYEYEGTPGDPCYWVNNCAPGYQCRSIGGEALCRTYCGDECDAGGGDSDSDTDTDTATDTGAALGTCGAGEVCNDYGDLGVGACG